jgi:ParB family chromosome partitioning protein
VKYKETILEIDQIDENDSTYRITTETHIEDLGASIEDIGLLNAPIIDRRDDHFIILSGFRRVAACSLLNIDQIKTRIVSSETPRLDRVKIAINENSFQRPLNLIETSRALNLMTKFIEDKTNLQATASKLALPENPKMIDNIMQLSFLPDSIQQAVLSETIGLPVALHLGKMKEIVAEIFVDIFRKLKFSLNKQREIILLSEEISHREDISLFDVLKNPLIDAIMNNKDMDRAQQGRELRRHLKQRRYPELSRADAVFEKEKKALKLENQIRLHPPLHFEGETYTFHFQFNTLKEYKKRLQTLNRIADHTSFKKIILRLE